MYEKNQQKERSDHCRVCVDNWFGGGCDTGRHEDIRRFGNSGVFQDRCTDSRSVLNKAATRDKGQATSKRKVLLSCFLVSLYSCSLVSFSLFLRGEI